MNEKELNKKILDNLERKIAISNYYKEDIHMNKVKITKIVATFVISVGLLGTITYAGTKIYEKVFTKPEKIENFIEELKVSEDDIKNIIAKEEAVEIAKKQIKRYGLKINDKDIENIELIKEPNYDRITYLIKTSKGLEVFIDANKRKLITFYNDSGYKVKELEKFTTTKENIIEEAKKKMKEYGFDDEYKVSYISNNGIDDSKAYFWYIWFSKEYDGLFNPGETVSMTIIPEINFVKSLNIIEEEFENNPIIISKEEAIKIAEEKDIIINTENYTKTSVDAKLEIKRMNAQVYLKENGLDNGMEVTILDDGTEYHYYKYKMNGKLRKVYIVEIQYKDKPFDQRRIYYVDTTTGEIIGGEDIFPKVVPKK